MAVCEDESVGRKDKARPVTLLFALRTSSAGASMMHFDADDGWSDVFDDAANGPGVGVQQLRIRESGNGCSRRRAGARGGHGFLIVRQSENIAHA